MLSSWFVPATAQQVKQKAFGVGGMQEDPMSMLIDEGQRC